MKSLSLLTILLCALNSPIHSEVPKHPVNETQAKMPVFAFANGVRRSDPTKAAQLLAGLGYEGIGSARLPETEEISAFLKAFSNENVKVFSFYNVLRLEESGEIPSSLFACLPELSNRGITLEIAMLGRKTEEHRQLAQREVKRLADAASRHGVQIVIYPHTGNFLASTFAEAAEFSRSLALPNVRAMFNLCHFLKVEPNTNLESTLRENRDQLAAVSLSGADKGGTEWSQLIQPLGSGTYSVESVLETLRELGYTGPVGFQCFKISGKPEEYLKQSIEAWRAMQPES